MTIRTIRSIEHLKAHPEMYLGYGGVVDPRELAVKIASGPIFLGMVPVLVDRAGDWWLVASPQDWLALDASTSVAEAFNRIRPFPTAGRNAMRAEVLLSAFADDVAVYGADGRTVVKGCEDGFPELEAVIQGRLDRHRVVAFRVKDSHRE